MTRLIFFTAVYTFFCSFSLISEDLSDDDVFSAAGVQFEICTSAYESRDAFFTVVEDAVIAALDAEYKPDIIIFPEYIGVFYQLIEFNEIVARHDTFQQALADVLAENPGFKSLADVFVKAAAWNSYLEGWAALSEKYNVPLVAGSCFVLNDDGRLRNRTYVFNGSGELIYQQDKVFLTDFERDIIGLAAGRLEDAAFFQVEGRDIALTICRDAYSTEWEDKNSGAFLWVDIKANGEVYDIAQQRSFLRALPSRLMNTNVDFGMTVCAVGSYLDLFWEGESSAVYKYGTGLALADISESCESSDRIVFNIATGQ